MNEPSTFDSSALCEFNHVMIPESRSISKGFHLRCFEGHTSIHTLWLQAAYGFDHGTSYFVRSSPIERRGLVCSREAFVKKVHRALSSVKWVRNTERDPNHWPFGRWGGITESTASYSQTASEWKRKDIFQFHFAVSGKALKPGGTSRLNKWYLWKKIIHTFTA